MEVGAGSAKVEFRVREEKVRGLLEVASASPPVDSFGWHRQRPPFLPDADVMRAAARNLFQICLLLSFRLARMVTGSSMAFA